CRRSAVQPEAWRTVVEERDRAREPRVPLRVVVRSDQRVYDPEPTPLPVARRARSLFGEDGMLGKLDPQPLEHGVLDGEIGLGDEVPSPLPVLLPALPPGSPGEAVEQDSRCLLGAVAHDLLGAAPRSGPREVSPS